MLRIWLRVCAVALLVFLAFSMAVQAVSAASVNPNGSQIACKVVLLDKNASLRSEEVKNVANDMDVSHYDRVQYRVSGHGPLHNRMRTEVVFYDRTLLPLRTYVDLDPGRLSAQEVFLTSGRPKVSVALGPLLKDNKNGKEKISVSVFMSGCERAP